MKSLKVLLYDDVGDGHHPEYLANFIRYLNENAKLTVLAPYDPMVAGKYYTALPLNRTLSRNKLIKNYQLLKDLILLADLARDFDIVHILDGDSLFLPLALITAIKPSLFRKKVFITVHWSATALGSFSRNSFYRRLRQLAFSLAANKSAGLIVHGEGTKSTLAPAVKEPGKIFPVPFGVKLDSRLETLNNADYRKKLGVEAEAPVILFFGEIRNDKGIGLLAAACRLLKRKFYVVIAGKPVDHLQEEVHSMFACVPAKLYLGYIPEEEISLLFKIATVLVLPYKPPFSGQSGPLSLAIANGVPVICTNTGELGTTVGPNGFGEVIKDYDALNLADAINKVLGYDKKQVELVKRKMQLYAEQNSVQVMVEMVQSAYYRV